jgi:hypothetical protein
MSRLRLSFVAFAFSLATAFLCVPTSLGAQTYDAVGGFSTTKNTDKSIWSYRYNTSGTRDGNYSLLSSFGINNNQWHLGKKLVSVPYWLPSNPSVCPCIWVNKHSLQLTANFCCGIIDLPARSLGAHPSTTSNIGDTVLSFLVPKAGTVTVTYSFTDIDPYGGNGIDWYVDLNSGLNGDLASGFLDSTPGNIETTGVQQFTIAVQKGDRINLIIDSRGDFHFDSTALTAIVMYD